MGLVERPDLPLGLTEWKKVEKAYLDRTAKEKEHMCPICFEDLHLQEE
jgi:hypothetical protein